MGHSAYEKAIDLVDVATKALKAAMAVVSADSAGALPSVDDLAKYARATWREACENEGQVYEQMKNPPKPEADPNQTAMDLPAVPGDEAAGETEERADEESGVDIETGADEGVPL